MAMKLPLVLVGNIQLKVFNIHIKKIKDSNVSVIYLYYNHRSGSDADCSQNTYHQLRCCVVPEFYHGHCEKFGTDHGVPNSCLDHGNLILEGKSL